MYVFTPVDTDRISAMPMMPIEPANEVSRVRTFLVFRLLKLNASDVANDIDARPIVLYTAGCSALVHDERVGVGADHAVAQVDDARGILFRKFGVVGDHDHEAVLGHVLEQVHDLHGRVRIERAGRLVGQDDVRVVDQCAGDRHALHLAAGQLVWLLVDVFAESDLLQRLARTFATVALPMPEIVSASSTFDRIVW